MADGGPRREICVLLGLYRSERYLTAQLDSLAAQQGVNWWLMVSDDAPGADRSGAILDAFSVAHPRIRIRRLTGPGTGFADNFLFLLRSVPPEVERVALCDHDDVWHPDRLNRAMAALDHAPADRPALYGARTMVCDAALRPLYPSIEIRRPPSFAHALVQSLAGGNTMALNRAGLDLARAAAAEAGEIVAHDWWLYQLVSGVGGHVIFDPEPVLSYRQHGENAIGETRSLRARLSRLRNLLGGGFQRWNAINLAALARSQDRLTPQAQACLAQYAAARRGPTWRRLSALRASGVHRQRPVETAALWLACLLGRL